ncbi:DSD1 family PLP-dependent enzyme [Lysobacter niastensis]|uniref:DSD1 family PLP-dependent enzyme n=2 Tax=Lysobacter niastensis TaxID=380629 RepID=A0ABS0B2A7_9GAMM|nr:DSD1 family PLP-dependent enzyme [Lysobacter niastensis]
MTVIMTTPPLESLDTPALVLDETRMLRNIERLRRHIGSLGVSVRPHLKTAKSVEVARQLLTDGHGPATVSTLKEAEVFAAAGVGDVLYAVGISPAKLPRVLALRKRGCDVSVVLDSLEQARAVAEASRESGDPIPVLIEIDCDGHRSGMRAGDPLILDIARVLTSGGAELRGVMTHAGESYGAVGAEALAAFAERERAAVVSVAETLRASGFPCRVVSMGSTPTAHFARDLGGVTEVRAGVHVFFDLVMEGIGVCSRDDIALSVLTTVIGHQPTRGWIIVDAGWMALSRDRGTASQAVDQGYGVVCDADGAGFEDLIVVSANQEHGIVALRPGSRATLPDLPVGTRLRILPNHACATAAQFDGYQVLRAGTDTPLAYWPRIRGW